MKRHFLLAILAVLGACDSSTNTNDGFKPDPVIHSLPSSKAGDALCADVDKVELVGGDLMAAADRIVVGTVRSVESVKDFGPDAQNCPSIYVNWTLRVGLDVTENLKGSGDFVEFNLSHEAQLTHWTAQPISKRAGDWTPADLGEPVFQVTQDLGWTDETGLQPGQVLLVFLWDNQGYSPEYMPLAQRQEDGTFKFQSDVLPGGCVKLPTSILGADLQNIETALAGEAAADPARLDFQGPTERFSTCSVIETDASSEPDVGIDF
ncbi:MAG: hypothetical protein R3E66_06510 [bacterium]